MKNDECVDQGTKNELISEKETNNNQNKNVISTAILRHKQTQTQNIEHKVFA